MCSLPREKGDCRTAHLPPCLGFQVAILRCDICQPVPFKSMFNQVGVGEGEESKAGISGGGRGLDLGRVGGESVNDGGVAVRS